LEDRTVLSALSVANATVNEAPASFALDPAGGVALGLNFNRIIAFDNIPTSPHYHDLFVTSYANPKPQILRFDWASQTYQRFVAPNSSGMTDIAGLAFGPDGNLFVSSANNSSIIEFDGTTGNSLGVFVPTGSGGLNWAAGMAFAPDGNLYVCSWGSNQILEYEGPTRPDGVAAGQFLGVFASTQHAPYDFAFGPDGNVYVSCPSYSNDVSQGSFIERYYGLSSPLAGQFMDTFVASGTGGLTLSRTPVFDQQGHLYVADVSRSQVLRFQGPNEPTPGAFIDAYVTSGLSGPIGLAFGPDGNLYVSSRDGNRVTGFGARASFLVTLDSASTGPVKVDYATANATAIAGRDSTATSGTLRLAPGVTRWTINVPILDDKQGGPSPVFTLNLSNPVGAIIAKGQGIGTIIDDDVTPLNMAVTPTSIPSGGTATVTLTAKDAAGNPLPGLPFAFSWSATGFFNTGSGSFGSVSDNHDGTYTANFTGTTAGLTSSITITASLFGQAIASNTPVITVTPPVPATQLAITNLNSASVAAGNNTTFTVTAEDSAGAVVPSYAGTVHFTSSDPAAMLPGDYTFTSADGGTHTFTVTLQSSGSQTISVTDHANNSLTATTSPITVNSSLGKFLVSIPSGNTIVAGNPFLVTVQAVDASGNPLTSYRGPATITISSGPPDPQNNFSGTLNSSGFGFFFGNLKTAGSYTLTATADTISGASGSLTVIPSDASYFTVTAPNAATTASPFNVTVTAIDHFGNVATGYTGTIKLTSTDPGAASLVDGYTFTTGPGKDNGVHTFSIALKTGGSQTIIAIDTAATNPAVVGASNAITTRGLVVSAFTPAAAGFTVAFTKPFNPSNLSLWGGTVASPIEDVTLVGDKNGPVSGSLIIDPTSTSVTFKASAIYLSTFFLSTVLTDDTWHVTLASGSAGHGFMDASGAGLDGGNNGGHADYTTSFTTANDGKPALSIPDFARGPDGGHTIKVPNESAGGIPVTLAHATAVTDVVFALDYKALFTPTGAGTADAPAGSAFTMGSITSIDATHATATFRFHNDTAQNGTVVLGDILASVPDAAANQYKAKELLGLGSITVNGAPFTGLAADGLHVNAYLGDVTGNGSITGLDLALANTVAQGTPTSPLGLAAYQLVDPAIVGDIAGDASIDATAVSDLALFASTLHPPQIPALPTGLTIAPGGPDPTLSLGRVGRIGNPSYVTVSVLLDNPRPEGSTGMTEAILALRYDPKALTVSTADITLGSLPGLGSGWQLVSGVDQASGQIGVDLYSVTPITAAQAGSLVNIVFHIAVGASPMTTSVQLVNAATSNGQHFATEVNDSQGQLVLSSGVDQVVIETTEGWTGLHRRSRLPLVRSKS
jgi:hypothetical protein